MKTKIKFLFYLCSVFLFSSCTDKANKFLGTWQNVTDTTITITITKTGDNCVFEGEDLKKHVATYNKEHDKLEVNVDNSVDNSSDKLDFIYVETTKHLIGDREEYKKQEWGDTSTKKFGRFKDSRDGKVYKIVKIGKQIWMAENLAYKTGTGSKAYNSNQRNVSVYGEEYSWESAIKACPSGWHLPTDDEWYTLIVYLGGRDVAGGKLKSTSIWTRPNTGATNSSGFTALPIFRQGEYGTTIDEYGIWWGSDLAGYPSVRTLQYDDSKVGYSGGTELAGGGYYSIRCIRD